MKDYDYILIVTNGDKSRANEARESLETQVAEASRMGYEPLGGISIAVTDYHQPYFAQAMIRYKSPERPYP